MEWAVTFLLGDLKQHPIIFVLCIIMIWQNVDLRNQINKVCSNFVEHLKNHARERR